MSTMLYYIVCGVLSVGVLVGISMMSKVEKAAGGNLLSAACTAAAIILTLYYYGILGRAELWLVMAAGLAAGLVWARRIKMIEMPQVVALLNGFGGAASAMVAAVSMLDETRLSGFSLVTAELALVVGAVTLTGSLVAAGKLHKVLGQRPVIWPGHQAITLCAAVATAVFMIASIAQPNAFGLLVFAFAAASSFFGIAFAIRVGGADMPITISLLNSLSGVAGAIAGMAISDPLLVSVGGIVGASGLLLTQVMCRAMNRSLLDILSGKSIAAAASAPAASAAPADEKGAAEAKAAREKLPPPKELLNAAKRVVIIPGYGMAIAQAQQQVKLLADQLEAAGKQVDFAIHPVAGRMPGHMNILLAEVDVPYEKLREMDDVNPEFPDCDVAVIIGANDVVNPAANTAEGTPIYGMPVLDAAAAKYVIVCNYDLSPGYAGVPNPLYDSPNAVLLCGNAAETLQTLLD